MCQADVWSLGCLLFELCTRKRAFDCDNMALLVKVTPATVWGGGCNRMGHSKRPNRMGRRRRPDGVEAAPVCGAVIMSYMVVCCIVPSRR